MKWTNGMRARLRLLLRGEAEERMEEELRFHIEMETDKNLRAGMSPAEARRRAVLAFGGVEGHKEAMRDGRTFAWADVLSLDLRLGLRMLAKYPGLTFIGGIGMAVGVAISVIAFSMIAAFAYPVLPLDEGARVVSIENRDVELNDEERRSLHDFVAWRRELRSVQDLGAFRDADRNLSTGNGAPRPVQVAEMTASGFRVARVAPLRGRYLVEDDEREGAPPVAVIAYDVWRERFASDPAVVGREIRIGRAVHTVVGVMPRGFGFPRNHRVWTPLRANPSAYERRQGPEIFIFGRLAPGVAMEEAQAELAAIGRRAAADSPETHARLRPRVMPYTHSLMDIQGGVPVWHFARLQLMMTLLLVVVALNVAVLVYARTATRHGEIAIRSALGAKRGRIVAQLFAEALVLSLAAAAVGFAFAQYGVRLGFRLFQRMEMEGAPPPFWQDYGLRPAAILFTIGLAVFAAVIVGVLPAMQATRGLRFRLSELGGNTGMKLGKVWTVLIVAQVALAVAVLPAAVNLGWFLIRTAATRPTYPAEEFLAARVAIDAASRRDSAAFADRLTELLRRLEAQPAVAGATYRAHLPGRERMIRVDGLPARPESPGGEEVSAAGVGPGFFQLFGARLLAGRAFDSGDAGSVVVNQAFVRDVLGGGGALGRRISHVEPGSRRDEARPGRLYEIVGVVTDLSVNPADPKLVEPAVYYPVAPSQASEVTLAIRVRGSEPAEFAPALREIAEAVDPSLRLAGMRPLASGGVAERMASHGVGAVLVLVLITVFLLSAAGIYALMSFTVTRRRKEIGIRTALGAQPGQVLRSVFARAAGQIALGVALGAAGALLLDGLTGGMLGGLGAVIVPALAAAMTIVGLLAAIGPARRGLRVQPMDVLRQE